MAKKEDKQSGDKIIWVVAIGDYFGKAKGEVVGYYDHCRRRVGDRFKIREREFSKKWMARVSDTNANQLEEEAGDREADSNREKHLDDQDAL